MAGLRITVEEPFVKALRKLPPDRSKGARTALVKFQAEPGLPGLRFRPLAGASGYYIINAAHGDRIILRKDGDDWFAAVDVGPHDNVYRRWNR